MGPGNHVLGAHRVLNITTPEEYNPIRGIVYDALSYHKLTFHGELHAIKPLRTDRQEATV